MFRGLALSAIALLSSCGRQAVVTLAELRSHRLTVLVSSKGTEVQAWLWPLDGDFQEPCPILEDRVSATLDGAPMNIADRGGYVKKTKWFYASHPFCGRPTFQVKTTTSAAATSEVRITDGTTTFRAVIRSLRTVRTFTVVDEFRRGADAHFVWSVASDVQRREPSLEADWSPEDGRGFYVWVRWGSPAARAKGRTVVLPVPSDATPGPGRLLLNAGFDPTVAVCEGIARCEGRKLGGTSFQVTLVAAPAEK